jgi:glutamine---fructose-6-phosphate transaminase (isomerizing)
MSLVNEIFEQPQALQRLLQEQRTTVEQIARAIHKADIRYVFLTARGTSDNAGRYANYLWGAFNRLPLALATPSLFTLYQQPPRLEGALVVAVSQSGQSPDIVNVLNEGKRQGCLTLAITNAPDSALSQSADFHLDIRVGPEKAVAATKTYTGELLAIAMLSTALDGNADRWHALTQVPGWIEAVLQQDAAIGRIAERYRFLQHCAVLGRGFNYCTAFEWSLKMKELAYVVAEPYSTADFMHGPIALVERGFPVMALAPSGAVYPDMLALIRQLRQQQRAELLVISDQPEVLALAQSPVTLPGGIPEWLSPLVAIVPAQLFAYHLTQARGLDTESPRTIHKITETN